MAIPQATNAAQLLRGLARQIRNLRERPSLRPLRVAILQGGTAHELRNFLEFLLLQKGFDPTFWQSEFGMYFEDAVLDWQKIADFQPDLIYVHTSVRNLRNWPDLSATETAASFVKSEVDRFLQIWDSLNTNVPGIVIQNNFEFPEYRLLGNLDTQLPGGASTHVLEVNRRLASEAASRHAVVINDIHYLSAQMGLVHWHNSQRWFSYKLPFTVDASFAVASQLTALIAARFGLSKKCLVLDLDNTLWGGVIGDDGVDRIIIGRETARAEAYTAFQEYCLALSKRGVILAVSSKNNEEIAREGFNHPDSILKLTDFACFRANWEPKDQNIRAIAQELNIGLDSLVFVDDNPAERALVAAQIPVVAVPDVGEEVSEYPAILDRQRYFEVLSITGDDLQRTETYRNRAAASEAVSQFSNYQEYLAYLDMTAEIGPFTPTYLDRITQLTNKSNQFNLTTRRYSSPELAALAEDPAYITLYVKLSDRFGDHGLISVVIAHENVSCLEIDLWLMSCRVLKRDVELLILDELVRQAHERSLSALKGIYLRTNKNSMVSGHYEHLGFSPVRVDHESSEWTLNVANYQQRNKNVKVHDTTTNPRTLAAHLS